MTESLSFLIGLTDLITFILSPEPSPRRGLTTGNYIAKEENSHSALAKEDADSASATNAGNIPG